METNYKLAEAQYFLSRLKGLKDNPDEFMYNLSAFLSAWRSVLDVLLYDYAEKYFGWGRDEKFDVRDFEVAAKTSGKKDAQDFIQWYKKQIKLLSQNPLWKKRVVIVHRGRPKVARTYFLYFSETIAVHESVTIEVLEHGSPSAIPPEKASFQSTADQDRPVEVYFEDCKDEEVEKICTQAYEQMKKIVEEAENTFK